MTSRDHSLFAGLDIGGTTVKAAMVDSSGQQMCDLVEVKSLVSDGYEATFSQLEIALDLLTEKSNSDRSSIKGIGLDVPAPSSNGVIWGRANLGEDWVGTDICSSFSSCVGIPVFMTNDGNAAAGGEYAIRPDYDDGLLFVAPGTGLGGGLVLPGGKIYEGTNGLALEVGHLTVPFMEGNELPSCSCGLKGCAEAWVSLVALRRRLQMELSKEIWQTHTLNNDALPIENRALQLRDLAEQGDRLALQLFEEQGKILGYAIADLVRLFDPGLVVIGGGLAEASFRDDYLGWIREGFSDRAWPIFECSPLDSKLKTTQFEWALGGDAAAALGMASVAKDLFDQ